MTNRFSGHCSVCDVRVAAESGEAVRGASGKWEVRCNAHLPTGVAAAPAPAAELQVAGPGRGLMVTPYNPTALPLLRALPGAKWDGERKAWGCSLDPADLPRVIEIATKLGASVPDNLRTAAALAEVMPEAAAGPEATEGLYPFQRQGVAFLARRQRALLGDEMGLGKTVQTLVALPEGSAVLVVCPSSLRLNWANEARRWAPSHKTVVLSGKKAFRLPQAGELVVINYDVLPVIDDENPLAVVTPFTCIFDEVQYAKNSKAARSLKVRALAAAAEKVLALTGTPLANRPMDLWGVLSNTGMARDVFGSWNTFVRCFNGHKNRWGGYEFGSPSVETPERLRRVMLRRLRAEVLPDLPRKQYSLLETNDLPADLQSDLDDLAGHIDEWGSDEDGHPQLPPFEAFSGLRQRLAASRVPAVLEFVERYEEEGLPLVVFSAHRAPVDELGRRDGWATITGDTSLVDRQGNVDAFQAGKLKGIALTITAGGTGLTLTRASHELFVDLDWVPANNAQAEDRCCRIGQTADSVQVTRMVSAHILDQHVHGLLAGKIAMITGAVDASVQVVLPKTRPVANGVSIQAEPVLPAVTEAERTRIHMALKVLAGMCDGARIKDGAGFNKYDSATGKALAHSGALTDGQVRLGARMVVKYKKQLEG